MAYLLDHIAAVIIGASVLLMLGFMQYRAQQASIQRTMTYVAKQQTLEQGRWMQEDLANVGSGMGIGAVPITGHEGDTLTTSFTFKRKLDPADASPSTIEYRLVPTDTLDVAGEAVKCYRVRRLVNGTEVGRSVDTITDFGIDMLDAAGQTTGSPSNVRFLRLRFTNSLPSPDKQEEYLYSMNWNTTIPIRNAN